MWSPAHDVPYNFYQTLLIDPTISHDLISHDLSPLIFHDLAQSPLCHSCIISHKLPRMPLAISLKHLILLVTSLLHNPWSLSICLSQSFSCLIHVKSLMHAICHDLALSLDQNYVICTTFTILSIYKMYMTPYSIPWPLWTFQGTWLIIHLLQTPPPTRELLCFSCHSLCGAWTFN